MCNRRKIRQISEGYVNLNGSWQRGIRGWQKVISGVAEGHEWGGEGHKRGGRGASVGWQKSISGVEEGHQWGSKVAAQGQQRGFYKSAHPEHLIQTQALMLHSCSFFLSMFKSFSLLLMHNSKNNNNNNNNSSSENKLE